MSEFLLNRINDNKEKNIIEKDLEENIKEVINQLLRYKNISNSIDNNLSKLNKYDYNTQFKEQNNIKNDLFFEDKNKAKDIKNNKSKNMKNKFKNLMKKRMIYLWIKFQVKI